MLLPSLPDDARLWLFASLRPLTDSEQAALLGAARRFVAGWTSHGRPVPAEAGLLHGRLLAIGARLSASEVNAGVSGCGIDSLQHALEAEAARLGFGWVGGLDVLFRDLEGLIRTLPRADFRRLAREGTATAETPVFDLTLDTVGALRTPGVERPAGASWHGRAFRLGVPTAPEGPGR